MVSKFIRNRIRVTQNRNDVKARTQSGCRTSFNLKFASSNLKLPRNLKLNEGKAFQQIYPSLVHFERRNRAKLDLPGWPQFLGIPP